MKRKTFIVAAVVMALVVVVPAVFLNSNYYYAKKLVSAIQKNDMTAVRQIVEKKPSCINTYPSVTSKWWQSAMNWRTYYPMNQACATGNIDLIELLIDNGADVNCNDGLTPLSVTYSIKPDNWYEISRILIDNGASLDYITEYSGGKSSVLQDIAHKRYVASLPGIEPENEEEVIKAFKYALENINYDNVDWRLVLQHSVSNDRIKIVKLLLDQKYCNVNDTEETGMTALMFAARDSTPEMVQFLLDYGADKSMKCSDGKTAYDYAVEFGNEQIAEFLKP